MYSLLDALGGVISFGCFFFWIVLIAVLILFLIKTFSRNKYAEESVIERWSAVLPGQADKAGYYLAKVEEMIQTRDLPFEARRVRIPENPISGQVRTEAPTEGDGFWGQDVVSMVSGEAYDFVACEMSADLSCFISCIPVGPDLEVSWLIQDHTIRGIYRLPVIGPLLLSVMKRYTFAHGNKIRALASATYTCAIEVAEQILDAAKADKSRLNRKTSGKLGPL